MNRILPTDIRLFPLVNITLLLLLVGVIIGACFFFRSPTEGLQFTSPLNPTSSLPSPKWGLAEVSYQNIGEHGLFEIKTSPVTQSLPDLRNVLQFYGKNQRPDAKGHEIYVGIAGSDEVFQFQHKEKVFLTFKKESNTPLKKTPSGDPRLWGETSSKNLITYNFSPDNAPTPLMVQFYLHGDKQVQVSVSLNQENVKHDHNFAQFFLNAIEPKKAPSTLGPHKLDPSVLLKQKAKWHGKDCFLQELGGNEYADTARAERVEFASEEQSYVRYFKENQLFIWKQNRWEKAASKEESAQYPLLILKKIEDKTLLFELWDLLGHKKINLNLVKTKEPYNLAKLKHDLRFIGAKTWGQFTLESGKQKFTVKPNDWLIFKDESWQKLDSETQVDAFVTGELTGPLLVIDKLVKKEGQQKLSTLLFSPSKSCFEKIELSSSHGLSLTPKPAQTKTKTVDGS